MEIGNLPEKEFRIMIVKLSQDLGKRKEVALIQIATKDKSFLFRINKIGFLPSIIDLLEDKNIKKIGLALKNDFKQLRRLADRKSTRLNSSH